jgi:hypothetical protein
MDPTRGRYPDDIVSGKRLMRFTMEEQVRIEDGVVVGGGNLFKVFLLFPDGTNLITPSASGASWKFTSFVGVRRSLKRPKFDF